MTQALRHITPDAPAEQPPLRLVRPARAVAAAVDVDRLVREHEPLVRRIAARVIAPWVGRADREDVLQDGRIGLWRAARLFDPSRGLQFSTYAWKAIERCMRASLRRRGRAMADVVTVGDWHEVILTDRAPKSLAGSSAARDVARQVERLAGRAREVMVRRLGLDGLPAETLEQIGERWGVSKEWVRQVQYRTIVLLRRRLGVCVEGEKPPPAVARRRRRCGPVKRKVNHGARR